MTSLDYTPGIVQFTRISQIERDNIERQALEKAAKIIEGMQGNPTYTQAWRLAARAIRRAKPD